MIELNRLLPFNPLTGIPRRTVQFNCDPQQGKSDQNGAVNRDFRQRVCAVMEDLLHRRRLSHYPFDQSCIANNVVVYQIESEFQIWLQIYADEQDKKEQIMTLWAK